MSKEIDWNRWPHWSFVLDSKRLPEVNDWLKIEVPGGIPDRFACMAQYVLFRDRDDLVLFTLTFGEDLIHE